MIGANDNGNRRIEIQIKGICIAISAVIKLYIF